MAGSPNGALQTWPYDKFGSPLLAHGQSVVDPTIRTPMERGGKVRQQFLTPILDGSYQVLMSKVQYLNFQAWHLHKLDNGTQWFNFKVWGGSSMSWEEVRMLGIYSPQPQGLKILVSFSIEQRTTAIPSESSLDAYLNA
ncbi:MAG: hypothetical protein Q8L20_10700 [Gammaproteobacteria bacterium]|nr:hypothetical protein [Gammaproteobacteria bacterium]